MAATFKRDFQFSVAIARQRLKEQLCKSVCLSVCLSVIKLSKQLHISSLALSLVSRSLQLSPAILIDYDRPSSISPYLYNFSLVLHQSHSSLVSLAISAISSYLQLSLLAISSSLQLSCQTMIGHPPQLHISLVSLLSLSSLVSLLSLASLQ